MSTKIYKINEIEAAAQQYGYKLGEILNGTGQKVAPSHNVKIKPKKWLETTVLNFIKKPTTPAGIYYIYLYSDLNKRHAPDVFPLQIGKATAATLGEAPAIPAAPIIIQAPEKSENVLSYESALSYQNTIAELRADVARLTAENTRLNDELDSEEEESRPGLAETAGSFLSQILPAADAWFKDRSAQRQLEFLKLKSTNEKMAQPYESLFLTPPAQAAAPQDQTNLILEKAEQFFNSIPAEHYQEIETLKPGCKNYQEFFNKIKEAHPETYAQLYTYIYE